MLNLKPFVFLSVVMLLGILVLGAIGTYIGIMNYSEKEFLRTYGDIEEGTELTVDNRDGDVTIRAWDDGHPNAGKIEVHATLKTVWGKKVLDQTTIEVTDGPQFRIKTEFEDKARWTVSVDMTIHVPSYIFVTDIETSNGDIDLEGLQGDLDVDTSNGDACIKDHNGSVDVHSSNGDVNLNNIRGNAYAYTYNNDITMRDVTGETKATSGNGRIDIRDVWTVRKAHTSNGAIYLRFQNMSAEGCEVESSNGNVAVYLPPDTAFRFYLDTSNGNIEVHGFSVKYDESDSDYKKGDVNGGGPKLDVDTSNGDIDIYAKEGA